MAEHLSALALDTLAAALPLPEAESHLATCGECRARLEALKTERAALLASPRFAAGLNRLAGPPVRPLLPRWVPPVAGVALAASLLLLVGGSFLGQLAEDPRLKGAVHVDLVANGTPVKKAKVGEKVSLNVGGAGHPWAAVFEIAESGAVSVLQPSTAVPAGARVKFGSDFEVTPGSLTVIACFSDSPVEVEPLRGVLVAEVVNAKMFGRSALEVALPEVGKSPCAKATLEVVP